MPVSRFGKVLEALGQAKLVGDTEPIDPFDPPEFSCRGTSHVQDLLAGSPANSMVSGATPNAGSAMVKREPLPGALSTSTLP